MMTVIRTSSGRWPKLIVLSAFALVLVRIVPVAPPVHVGVSLWFLSVCPGMAFIRLLDLRNRVAELVLAIAASLTIDTIVNEIAVYTRTWSADLVLMVLISVALVGTALQIMKTHAASSRLEQRQ